MLVSADFIFVFLKWNVYMEAPNCYKFIISENWRQKSNRMPYVYDDILHRIGEQLRSKLFDSYQSRNSDLLLLFVSLGNFNGALLLKAANG